MADTVSATTPTAATPASAAPAFNPAGKTLQDRLDAFFADAKATHGVSIGIQSGSRDEAKQHKMHISHMFLYNAFNAAAPHHESGKKTISWEHFSDPTVIWLPDVWCDFLRTKTGGVPSKDATTPTPTWTKDQEPDQKKTEERCQAILTETGAGNGGKAMVACAYKPCPEPCGCAQKVSKHLTDPVQATDLNTADLEALTTKLSAANAGDLDAYLKKFGLCRPLLPTETWHVESQPD